jgi:hypothetical protein
MLHFCPQRQDFQEQVWCLAGTGWFTGNGKYQASQTIPRPEAPGYNGYGSPSTEHLGKTWVGIKRDFDFRVAKSKSSRFHSEVSKSAWDSLVINHCAANQCTLGPRPLMHNVGSDVPFPKSVLWHMQRYAKTIPVSFQFCSTKVIIQVCDYPHLSAKLIH